MGDSNLDSDVPYELVERLAERTLDGVLIVDEKFCIHLGNLPLYNLPISQKVEDFIGKDYFQVVFGLNTRKPGDLKRAKKTPLYEAFEALKNKNRDLPYSTVTELDVCGLVYQVETRLATSENSNSKYVLELWRRLGDAEVFEDDSEYIKI